MIYNLY